MNTQISDEHNAVFNIRRHCTTGRGDRLAVRSNREGLATLCVAQSSDVNVDEWRRRRREHSSLPGISVLGSADIRAPSLRACTALCLERRASAVVVTVHGRTCGY